MSKSTKHILIIPSEEFQPIENQLAGIFQRHQAESLEEAGYQIGIISIKLEFSIPMFIKSLVRILFNISPRNALDTNNLRELYKTFKNRFFKPTMATDSIGKSIPVLRITGGYFFKPSRTLDAMSWVFHGKRIYKEYLREFGEPDLIYAHNVMYAGLLAHGLKMSWKVPYIIQEHSSFIARDAEPLGLSPWRKKAYSDSSENLAVSGFLANKIQETHDLKTSPRVLPNIVDPALFNAAENTGKSNLKEFTFISIGSLIPLKRHSDIIHAFANANFPSSTRLHIAGSGELMSHLNQLIDHYKLTSQVSLLGLLNRQGLIPHLRAADCLIVASEIETFGVSIIEAMSFGLPCISSRCGGPESIITNETGLLFPIGDVEELSKKMIQIFDYRGFDSQKIKAHCDQHYSPKAFNEQFAEILKAV